MSEENSKLFVKNVHVDMNIGGRHYEVDLLIQCKDGIYKLFDTDELSNVPNLGDYAYYDGYRVNTALDLVKWEAFYLAGDQNIVTCDVTGFHIAKENTVILYDDRICAKNLAKYFEPWDNYYLRSDMDERMIRNACGDSESLYAPTWYFNDLYYCSRCDCYVSPDDWDDEEDECRYCASKVIDDYCESHRRGVIYFGEYESEEDFQGLGFELEVDCSDSTSYNNNSVAKKLCSTVGLEENEMRYAHDGSLNYGFECISQPHTVKDFWSKQEKWAHMLKYLLANGYRSHDPNTCGLHVHVSRRMFGKTQEQQDEAIAKVYTFFDNNWDDLVRVSRRTNFEYCDKNRLHYEDRNEIALGKSTRLKKWRKSCKGSNARGHYVALNNANADTFEYRLGRGTLNPWSFFSWIDLVVTITNNAKRITVNKVESNDLVSWLGGIKESTAKYIYKRGAFRATMLALYPSIEWELSNDDSSNE